MNNSSKVNIDYNDLFVIINPAAGSGRAVKRWQLVERHLLEQQKPYSFRLTSMPGQAGTIVSDALMAGVKLIGVVGGDGTLHEVLQGIFNEKVGPVREGVRLLYLGGGTSSDFQKLIPREKSLPEKLESQTICPVDIIRLDCCDNEGNHVVKYAVNGSNIGLIALGTMQYNSNRGIVSLARKFGTNPGYIAAGIKSILSHVPSICLVSVDEQDFTPMVLNNCTVFKNPWVCGGMRFGVNMMPGCGKMVVLTAKNSDKYELLSLIPRLYFGDVSIHPNVDWQYCRKIEIKTGEPVIVEADGELAGYTPVKYSILPGALNVVV